MYILVHGPIGGRLNSIREMSDDKADAAIARGFATRVMIGGSDESAATADNEDDTDS